jgi:hypothetical protein
VRVHVQHRTWLQLFFDIASKDVQLHGEQWLQELLL